MEFGKEYIKLFDTERDYSSFKDTIDFITPNVSLVDESEIVHYTLDLKQYLSFVAKEDCTFKFSGNTINYSLDDGSTWVTLASDTDTPTVQSGDTIMWKGSNLAVNATDGIGRFYSSGKFDVEGNVMSLLYGDDFEDELSLSGKNYVFSSLFKPCTTQLESAKRMLLPATTLANDCYRSMFQGCTSLTEAPELPATTLEFDCYREMFAGCTSLTEAPELPATTLTQHCYNNMFEGCTSLNKITCLATDISAIYCTQEWVNGVAENGTFVKNASMSSWTSGVNGIPSGWTVTNAT